MTLSKREKPAKSFVSWPYEIVRVYPIGRVDGCPREWSEEHNKVLSAQDVLEGVVMSIETGAALVIGGSGGMGRAIALRMVSAGWRVGLVGRDGEKLEQARRELAEVGVTGIEGCWTANVCQLSEAVRVAREFEERAGVLDSLVMAAGRLRGVGPLETVKMEEAWEDLELSLRGTANVVRAALPGLRRSNAASISVLIGPGYNGELAHASLYSAAQAGLARLVESLARELEPSKVAIYGVYPGLAPTPLMERLLDTAEGRRWLPRFTEAFAEGKEVGTEVGAELVAWLAVERPMVLSGRVIPALQTPELLALRLPRYGEDGDLGKLRLK